MKQLEKINKSNYLIGSLAAQYLRVSDKKEQVYFAGISGAQMTEDLSIPGYKLRVNNPSVVIMDIETNDLADGYGVHTIPIEGKECGQQIAYI